MTAICCALGLVVAAVLYPRSVTRRASRHARRADSAGRSAARRVVLVVPMLSYFGRGHFWGPAHADLSIYRANLVSLVVPGHYTWLSPVGRHLPARSSPYLRENGAYLGIPVARRAARRRDPRLAACRSCGSARCLLGALLVLSLGDRLNVTGRVDRHPPPLRAALEAALRRQPEPRAALRLHRPARRRSLRAWGLDRAIAWARPASGQPTSGSRGRGPRVVGAAVVAVALSLAPVAPLPVVADERAGVARQRPGRRPRARRLGRPLLPLPLARRTTSRCSSRRLTASATRSWAARASCETTRSNRHAIGPLWPYLLPAVFLRGSTGELADAPRPHRVRAAPAPEAGRGHRARVPDVRHGQRHHRDRRQRRAVASARTPRDQLPHRTRSARRRSPRAARSPCGRMPRSPGTPSSPARPPAPEHLARSGRTLLRVDPGALPHLAMRSTASAQTGAVPAAARLPPTTTHVPRAAHPTAVRSPRRVAPSDDRAPRAAVEGDGAPGVVRREAEAVGGAGHRRQSVGVDSGARPLLGGTRDLERDGVALLVHRDAERRRGARDPRERRVARVRAGAAAACPCRRANSLPSVSIATQNFAEPQDTRCSPAPCSARRPRCSAWTTTCPLKVRTCAEASTAAQKLDGRARDRGERARVDRARASPSCRSCRRPRRRCRSPRRRARCPSTRPRSASREPASHARPTSSSR